MATRGSYVHISMGIILGGIPIMLVLCNFLRKLMVSNKKIHRALRTHIYNSYEQYPLEKFFIFTIYPQNYTLALIVTLCETGPRALWGAKCSSPYSVKTGLILSQNSLKTLFCYKIINTNSFCYKINMTRYFCYKISLTSFIL